MKSLSKAVLHIVNQYKLFIRLSFQSFIPRVDALTSTPGLYRTKRIEKSPFIFTVNRKKSTARSSFTAMLARSSSELLTSLSIASKIASGFKPFQHWNRQKKKFIKNTNRRMHEQIQQTASTNRRTPFEGLLCLRLLAVFTLLQTCHFIFALHSTHTAVCKHIHNNSQIFFSLTFFCVFCFVVVFFYLLNFSSMRGI